MNRRELLFITAALLIGGALWFVVNLEPVWELAWFVPGLLFVLALETGGWQPAGFARGRRLIWF